MNVYVEYVVLDNLVLDTLLLWGAAATLRIPFKKWRVALGGATGTVFAVASAYVYGVWLYLLKAVCLVLMCIAAVGFGKKLFWHILLTLTYTFVAGGAIVGLFNLFNVSLVDEGKFYDMRVPLFVYLLAAAAAAFLCYSIVVYVKQVKKVAPNLVKVTVRLRKSYALTGFCDSGNTLTHDGVPVCFVTKKFGGFADYFAEQVLARKAVDVCVYAMTGAATVKAVPATVVVNGNERQVYLALPKEKCQTMYNILLNSEFCGG